MAVGTPSVTGANDWFEKRNELYEISEITGTEEAPCKIAVEAAYYLQQFIDLSPTAEPLLSALGGFPLALKKHIESDLVQWKQANIQPFFIFEGMSTIDREESELNNAKEANNLTNNAWGLYTDNKATAAVTAFGRSGAVKAKKFVRFFQEILLENNVEFCVAPYSACGLIAYLDSLIDDPKTGYVDAIMGSYELLLFNVDHIITKINFEDKKFSSISRKAIQRELAATEDTFVDALLCTGMYGVPPFPPLVEGKTLPQGQDGYDVKAAVLMIKSSGRTVGKMCENLVDKMNHPDWELKYQRAKMNLKHHITLTHKGRHLIREYDQLTADNHKYLGLQLPDELLYYLEHGAINPRILNWMGSLEMLIHPPLDGGDSEEYKLICDQLVPIKQQTLALLASRLNRAFQHKNVTMKVWYVGGTKSTMNPNDVTPKPAELTSTWCVKETQYRGQKNSTGAVPGTMTFALSALTDSKFAASTTKKEVGSKLHGEEEIICNILWRFLHLRGYINDKHELTTWGKALLAALEKVSAAHPPQAGHDDLEEAILLAFELIRYKHLNTRYRYEQWIGGPIRGSDEDKADCLLLARVACLAKIQHKPIGYTGPLSRNLLAFHSITTAVRESARDLIETIFVSMMLTHETSRNGDLSLEKLALRLPFWKDIDCALGIAVKTYLDDYAAPNQSEAVKISKKIEYANSLIPHNVNFAEDLDAAFDLFDAVYAGVQVLKDEAEDKSSWDRANAYLALRR